MQWHTAGLNRCIKTWDDLLLSCVSIVLLAASINKAMSGKICIGEMNGFMHRSLEAEVTTNIILQGIHRRVSDH
jgi:hypothetical protein